ncbi:MAG: DNA-processing protein DprA [Burkholderiaceae bacterium]
MARAAQDDAGELAAWLRLLAVPSIGRVQARQVLAAFGTPQEIFEATDAERVHRVGRDLAAALSQQSLVLDDEVAKVQAWVEGGPSRRWITIGDALYPQSLLQTADPPLLLYLQGRAELLGARCLAIVGSRNPTAQGADNARAFAEHLGRAGLVVVSGMALGIDGAAHMGALASGAGTIAVIGTGADRIYPRRHRDLAHRIAESGLIVSEFPLGTPPLAPNFPQRNRIIAGLAVGTLVVEAALESGSLITAAQAADAGREVFAIPGSIHSPQSRGCHALIKQGAKLVETAQDVLDEIGGFASPPAQPQAATAQDPAADPLLETMGYEPVSLDELQARTGLATGVLSARLLELELAGALARLPGGMYQRRGAG